MCLIVSAIVFLQPYSTRIDDQSKMILPVSTTSSSSSSSSSTIIHNDSKTASMSTIMVGSTVTSVTTNQNSGSGSSTLASSAGSVVTSTCSVTVPSVSGSGNSTTTSSSTTSIGGNSSSTNMSCNSAIIVECAGCGSTILDRYYLSAVDQHWHVSCLKCSQCKVNLQAEPSCFSRDGLIFCKSDYYRLFTMRRCSRCGEGIYASELVMRVRDHNVYHIQCFTCAWCNVTLSQGDLFGIRDNLVYCRNHYEMLSSSTSSIGSNNMNNHHHHHHHNNNSNVTNNNIINNNSSSSPTYGTLSSSTTPPPTATTPMYLMQPSEVLHRHHGHLSPHHHFHHLHHHHPHLIHGSGSSPSPPPPPSSLMHHHHHHGSNLDPTTNSSSTSSLITGETCSTMAATPYTSNSSGGNSVSGNSGGLYSPLSITNLSASGGGGGGGGPHTPNGPPGSQNHHHSQHNGQSPTTPQCIRKGRPRKRKNQNQNQNQNHHHSPHHIQQAQEVVDTINSCSHESLSSPSSRNTHSPSLTNALDGGPLSGLAASIENSCNSQLSNSALNLTGHGQTSNGNGGGQRTKRMRTSFKHHQLRTMKTYFSVNQNPDAKDLKQLAQKTGLSKRVLQVWFQNARAKWRRNNLKMLPDAQELALNGQTMLNLGHPSTPSTVIGSPSSSTRPYSSPSPAMSPSTTETSSLSHQTGGLGSGSGPGSVAPQPQTIEAFVTGRTTTSTNEPPIVGGPAQQVVPNLIPMNFQELY